MVCSITLVTVEPVGFTVAYGQVMMVEVSTTVVTPPMVWVPGGTTVVVGTGTVVSDDTVTVEAGMV